QIFIRFPGAKVFVDERDCLVVIKITTKADRHIVWSVICVEILLDCSYGRILKVVNCSDNSLGTVRVLREHGPVQILISFPVVIVKTPVLFFVNSLKFRMEQARYD